MDLIIEEIQEFQPNHDQYSQNYHEMILVQGPLSFLNNVSYPLQL